MLVSRVKHVIVSHFNGVKTEQMPHMPGKGRTGYLAEEHCYPLEAVYTF